MLLDILIIMATVALGIYLLPFILFTAILLVTTTSIITEEIWFYLKRLLRIAK